MSERRHRLLTSTRPWVDLSWAAVSSVGIAFLLVLGATGWAGARKESASNAVGNFVVLALPTSYFWIRGVRGLREPIEQRLSRRRRQREENLRRIARRGPLLRALEVFVGLWIGLVVVSLALGAENVKPHQARGWVIFAGLAGVVISLFIGRVRANRLRRKGYD